jgi:hypothetical protein
LLSNGAIKDSYSVGFYLSPPYSWGRLEISKNLVSSWVEFRRENLDLNLSEIKGL